MTRITVPSQCSIAEVTPWPDEVNVRIDAQDGMFTLEQATELANAIIAAVARAGELDWHEKENGDLELVERGSLVLATN